MAATPAEPMREAMAFTTDAFHRGRFHLVQPAGKGHRAGLDAMLLAGAVPEGFGGLLADLGAGAGAVGFAVAARCAKAHVVLVERAAEMAACARESLALPENDVLASRIAVVETDVELSGRERQSAGLADRSFDFVVMNPPFNTARDRATPDTLKRQAHVMEDGLFERWLRTAAAIAKPGAGLAIIARPGSIAEILAALAGRFGSPEVMPIHPRPPVEAIRIIVRARKGARGGLRLQPPLVLHGESHGFTQRAEMVINGRATLFGD
ncbi:tRNA1(Val) (adenine(37)-N6)-methyltransferase [Chelativorans alearense]|uniref:tRNA1(Val) (adenine(37)-N6)-methyltransferase n=1 Tax=Chelativorans alearense TaxID=2681495 RepID=UPI0013D7E7DA|nr:methyltransferase [Chelativorans alearense]